MDWIALSHDPLWLALWESDEVKTWMENQTKKLVDVKWDAEDRGVIRGQIMAFQHLKRTVEMNAKKQAEDHDKVLEKASAKDSERVRRFNFPRIS